jgi:hypothetical protein
MQITATVLINYWPFSSYPMYSAPFKNSQVVSYYINDASSYGLNRHEQKRVSILASIYFSQEFTREISREDIMAEEWLNNNKEKKVELIEIRCRKLVHNPCYRVEANRYEL